MKKIILILVVAITVYACSSSNSDNPAPKDNFDRKAMLTHMADDIIIPAFKEFNDKLIVLKEKTAIYNSTPSIVTLQDVRASYNEAYKAWQHVAMFNIGKAEELQFVNYFNIFPTNVTQVETNIMSGTYDLAHTNSKDEIGFPALDYLFYGIAVGDTAIVAKYTGVDAVKYKKYLTDVVTKMSEVTTLVVSDWNGAFRDSFVNNSGNSGTASVNKIVNDYVFHYEKGIRSNKFGIPVGSFSGGTTFPEKVEAFYQQNLSKELALEALNASQSFFKGKNFGASNVEKLGFNAYLIALDRSDLATLINSQFDNSRTQINTLGDNFTEQITNNNVVMTKAFDKLQKNIISLKVGMMQAFGISLDAGYVDNDGD
ncbi:peptidase M75 superfamily protein [Tenacibaculum sp. Bg11-29]|uniref:imelysin family protein n=1 Tax=Tenacibaculum sp. Bg11-29 TaxID=2058306 RepID=UPI000C31D80E|nr:imelysin family protein [Tenacibaculum sp. Bg11-29]PKH51205.1 peptidase M75 superfamily protein [Tenacibaculum sp. Bg11-29]